MLELEDKILHFKNYLIKKEQNYADSFKDDIVIFFEDKFDLGNSKLNFLNNYNSKEEIEYWVEKLISRFVMKFDNEFEMENDFIYDYLVNG